MRSRTSFFFSGWDFFLQIYFALIKLMFYICGVDVPRELNVELKLLGVMKLTNDVLESIDAIWDRMESGEVKALDAYVALKEVEKYLAKVLKGDIAAYAMEDYESRGEKEVRVGAYRVKAEPRGVRWDYSGCGDPVRDDLKESLARREKWLQGLKSEVVLETGETVRPAEQKFTVSLVVAPVTAKEYYAAGE